MASSSSSSIARMRWAPNRLDAAGVDRSSGVLPGRIEPLYTSTLGRSRRARP